MGRECFHDHQEWWDTGCSPKVPEYQWVWSWWDPNTAAPEHHGILGPVAEAIRAWIGLVVAASEPRALYHPLPTPLKLALVEDTRMHSGWREAHFSKAAAHSCPQASPGSPSGPGRDVREELWGVACLVLEVRDLPLYAQLWSSGASCIPADIILSLQGSPPS